jgi:hypothetical protein
MTTAETVLTNALLVLPARWCPAPSYSEAA